MVRLRKLPHLPSYRLARAILVICEAHLLVPRNSTLVGRLARFSTCGSHELLLLSTKNKK